MTKAVFFLLAIRDFITDSSVIGLMGKGVITIVLSVLVSN